MNTCDVGSQIRTARLNKNWTQRILADLIGVDRLTIISWEKNRSSPPEGILLRRLQAALEIKLIRPIGQTQTETDPLGRALMILRQRAGFTQAEGADLLKVSRGLVCHWEGGRRMPPQQDMLKLAVLYGVPVNG